MSIRKLGASTENYAMFLRNSSSEKRVLCSDCEWVRPSVFLLPSVQWAWAGYHGSTAPAAQPSDLGAEPSERPQDPMPPFLQPPGTTGSWSICTPLDSACWGQGRWVSSPPPYSITEHPWVDQPVRGDCLSQEWPHSLVLTPSLPSNF